MNIINCIKLSQFYQKTMYLKNYINKNWQISYFKVLYLKICNVCLSKDSVPLIAWQMIQICLHSDSVLPLNGLLNFKSPSGARPHNNFFFLNNSDITPFNSHHISTALIIRLILWWKRKGIKFSKSKDEI